MTAISDKRAYRTIVQAGDKYGLLTIICEAEKFKQPSGQTQRGFLCACECGEKKVVRLSHLRTGRVSSCGHLGGERHGLAGTPLYGVWRGMIDRCTSEKCLNAATYYHRGIKLCDEWRNSFTAFKDWALRNGWGKRLTIDRIDNEKGYCPENCRIVTQAVNNCNRRNTVYVMHKGEKTSLSLLIKKMGKSKKEKLIMERVRHGWEYMKAIKTPVRQGNYRRGPQKKKLETIIERMGI